MVIEALGVVIIAGGLALIYEPLGLVAIGFYLIVLAVYTRLKAIEQREE